MVAWPSLTCRILVLLSVIDGVGIDIEPEFSEQMGRVLLLNATKNDPMHHTKFGYMYIVYISRTPSLYFSDRFSSSLSRSEL